MTREMYGDDFAVGDIFDTAAITMTETHVVNWAGLTGDFYPSHMDAEFAATTQFGQRLVHGPMIFAMAVGLAAQAGFAKDSVIAWLGVDNMRMSAPVFIGDTIKLRVEVKEQKTTSDPKRGIQMWLYTVTNQRDELIMNFEYKMMFHMRAENQGKDSA